MPKQAPLRMCVVCRTMLPKNELFRFVRTAEGIDIDTTGKTAGRGAYVCKKPECIAKSIKKRAFDKVFSERLNDGIYEQLQADYDKLTKNQ